MLVCACLWRKEPREEWDVGVCGMRRQECTEVCRKKMKQEGRESLGSVAGRAGETPRREGNGKGWKRAEDGTVSGRSKAEHEGGGGVRDRTQKDRNDGGRRPQGVGERVFTFFLILLPRVVEGCGAPLVLYCCIPVAASWRCFSSEICWMLEPGAVSSQMPTMTDGCSISVVAAGRRGHENRFFHLAFAQSNTSGRSQ